MFSGPRRITILLAACISTVVTAFMSLVTEISTGALLLNFFIAFSASYLLSYIFLEFLIFREINRLYSLLDKLRKKEFDDFRIGEKNKFNPLKRINTEIYNYALVKQREIDDLKKVEVFRKEFIANVSHEIKTPLFAAQGFVHTLLDGAVKDKSVRNKFLKKAAKSLDALDILVQDLLTLSSIETGEIKMHFENFDIVTLSREILDQFEEKAEKKSITLKLSKGSPQEAMVYADWKRINQVLTNLISNAVKYNREGGSVKVGFKEQADHVIIYVEDDGEGIPEKDLHRIFERFYRVDKSRSREKGGTGLGLAIVKHIMESHNSIVEVKSILGKGSKFTFRLPRAR